MFLVRRAIAEDADAILKITQEAFLKYIELAGISDTQALHETKEQVLADIAEKIVYVAYMQDHVVGSVRVEVKDENTAYLSRFGVNTEFQNLGIGKSLMNALDMELSRLGIRQVMLHTASRATPLVKFYYNRGFYIDSTTKDKGYIRALLVKDIPQRKN